MSTLSSRGPHRLRTILCLFGLTTLAAWVVAPGLVRSQTQDQASADKSAEPSTQPAVPPRPAGTSAPAAAPANPAPTPSTDADIRTSADLASAKDPTSYGPWTLIPAAVAILLAVVARQVIPALVVGIFVGAFMLVPCLGPTDPYAPHSTLVAGFRLAAERYILGAVNDPGENYAHATIMMFTMLIGFLVGVMGRNGGTAGMVQLVAGRTQSPRRGALTAWLAGMVVFFDDYANTMIVGPTMRSVFDKLKLSRAKLAYIVDSTAAPVASIAIVGTWVGFEINFIQQGLTEVAQRGAPLLDAQGNELSGMQVFINSIAYRFYPLLAIFLVFLVSLTGRDFGPMRRSESRALSRVHRDPKPGGDADGDAEQMPHPRWWLGFVPVLVLVGTTVGVLISSGLRSEKTLEKMRLDTANELSWAATPAWEKASIIMSNADAYLSIFYGAVLAAIVAVSLTILAKSCPTRKAIDAGLDGMTRMFTAIVILILAWALSSLLQDLRLGEVARLQLQAWQFPIQWLPLSIFISAAVISFATGTSWGTLGILCPITVTIAAGLTVSLDPAEGLSLFYAAVGSVLAGAVFGDHCSPISDTTVLSSIASDCPHEEHVWTQIPYALVTAIAAMGLGDVLCSGYRLPWYVGLLAGATALTLFLFIFGRKAKPDLQYARP